METTPVKKTKRQHLQDHMRACKDIELTQIAIGILERVTGCQRVVQQLRKKQEEHLRRIDAAAEKLGAPYGS